MVASVQKRTSKDAGRDTIWMLLKVEAHINYNPNHSQSCESVLRRAHRFQREGNWHMKDEECNDDERIGKPVSENLVILPWGRQVKKF